MILSKSIRKEEEQLFKNYTEFTGVELSTLFKRALLERIELEQDLKTIAEYEKEKANGTLKLYDVEEVMAELGV